MSRRVLVTGGRDYMNRDRVFRELDRVHAVKPISLLMHGACTDPRTRELVGADRWAQEWAIARQVPYLGVPAQWTRYGAAAGPMRNSLMLEQYAPGLVVAFPGGRGTADMLRKAHASRAVEVIEVAA